MKKRSVENNSLSPKGDDTRGIFVRGKQRS